MRSPRAHNDDIPRPFFLVILMVSLLVIPGGLLFYNSQKNKIVREKQNELAAISTLKIEEIESWRMEHIRDGEILSSIIPRDKLIFNFLENKVQPELRMELLQRIKIFIGKYDYHSILLVDTTGSVKLVYPPSETVTMVPFDAFQFNELNKSEISLSDLHYSDDLPGMVHIDLEVPLFLPDKGHQVKVGTILLRIDPEKKLYPLIQSWPTPSKSSETLIVRMENDSVLYLNELRHQKKTATIFKLPLNENLVSAKAVLGYEGIFEGKDYRGVPVISFLQKIPDSPWFMVAKVDKKEIYSPLKEITLFICVIAFLIIFLFSGSFIYFWRSQRIRYLREINSTKDKFFSIVSHDLKSPFTSISGFANFMVDDLYKEDYLDKENLSKIRKYAEIIVDSTQNAMDLLKNLTEWSRLHTDKLVFNPREIDVIAIIDEVTELMSTTAMQKSIEITKKAPPRLIIYADKEMIGSVLRNLISNSIKFSNPGGKVHISAIEKENEIIIDVMDFGIGMTEETIDKLFRIGESISTPGTQKEHGTGLGLILVKEFVSLHGGEVHIESKVGRCCKIGFTLPVTHNE